MLRSKIRLETSQVARNPTRPEVSNTVRDGRPPFDWKGWVVLAWVLWFGLSYGKMVFAQRSDKISDLVALLMKSI
jgi:hypothetical protein